MLLQPGHLISHVGRVVRTLPSSTVFQIDASLAASYAGSGQTWSNVCGHPADGGAKADYDWWLGRDNTTAADDLAFAANKFTANGSNFAEIKASTAFLNNLLRSDLATSWWSAAAFLIGTGSVAQTLYGTSNGSNVPGWRFDANTTPTMRLIRADGTTNQTTNLHVLTGLTGVPLLHVFTWNNATQSFKSALNSRTFNSTGAATAFPQTASNTGKLNFGCANHATQKISSGSELYGLAMGSGTLMPSDLVNIVMYFNALHGRTYA